MIEDRKNSQLAKPKKKQDAPLAPRQARVEQVPQSQLDEVANGWESLTVAALSGIEAAKRTGIQRGIDRVNAEEVPVTEEMFRGLISGAIESAIPQ